MKAIIILSFLFATSMIFSQEFVSNKQEYYVLTTDETHISNDKKLVIIDSNTITFELPNGKKYIREIKYIEDKSSGGKVGKMYGIQKTGQRLVIYDDEIFINLASTDDIAVTYYLENYKERTEEQLKILEQEREKSEYDSNVTLYGVFTADCIREKKNKSRHELYGNRGNSWRT